MTTTADPRAARAHLGEVARGSALTFAGAVVSTVATFALVIVVTRNVEPEAAGRFFAATAVFVMALAAAGLGSDTGLARFVLRADGSAQVRGLVRTAALPVLVVTTALALLLGLWVPGMRVLVWALPFAAAADLSLAALRAHATFRSTVLIDRIVRPGVQLLLVVLVLAWGRSGAALAVAWAAGYVVSALLAMRALHRHLPGGLDVIGAVGADSSRAFWSFTWPRAVARIAQVAIQKLDIVLVAALLGTAEAAAYTVATRFVVFGQLANQAVSSVVQPRFTLILTEDADDRTTLNRVFGTTTCWSMLLAWPVYACVAAAPSAYLAWFGDGYASTENTVVVLVMVAGMLVAVASGPVDTLLLMSGRSGRSLANTLLALAVDVGLCLLLVPMVGIAGAALAWVASVVLRTILAGVQLHADLELRADLRGLALPAALPLVCVAVPLLALDRVVGLGAVSWLAASAGALACYAGAVWRWRVRLGVDVALQALTRRRRPVMVP